MRTLLIVFVLLAGCASAPSRPAEPARALRPSTPLDPAVRFSVSQQAFAVAKALVADCLSQDRMSQFKTQHGRRPVVKVVPSLLLQSGSIDPLVLEKLVEGELVGSGRVRVISAASLSQNRDGVLVQVPAHSPRPDFVLTVAVAAVQPTSTDGAVVVTTLELIHLQSNQKVWMKVHRAGENDAPRIGARSGVVGS